MPSKRKPVVRAWKCPNIPTWRALLVGKALYAKWPASGHKEWVRLNKVFGGIASVLTMYRISRGYVELSPTEANRLNAARVRANGRKP